jgi:hypothetical protein
MKTYYSIEKAECISLLKQEKWRNFAENNLKNDKYLCILQN